MSGHNRHLFPGWSPPNSNGQDNGHGQDEDNGQDEAGCAEIGTAVALIVGWLILVAICAHVGVEIWRLTGT